ncbi:hypothetical protein Pelo_19667 [Pelomyxa schiedti]|nr:hypothetical protein Pelo_19667 [Pelomyxa schiedti]
MWAPGLPWVLQPHSVRGNTCCIAWMRPTVGVIGVSAWEREAVPWCPKSRLQKKVQFNFLFTHQSTGTTTAASNVNRKVVELTACGPSVVVQCPVQGCGATSTRVHDVSMLTTDISTRDYLLQVMKDKEEEPEQGLCMLGHCIDENSVAKKATLTCLRCKGMLFCESCFHIRHKAPGIKSHKVCLFFLNQI